ncbi:MAG: DUF4446 family protein [Armatimonadetes bacterium]|nr:DUF4446 family protein [Armatimonadota bacterium]
MDSLTKLLEQGHNGSILLLLITAVCVVMFLLVTVLLVRVSRLNQRIHALTMGTEGNLEQVLAQNLERVTQNTLRMNVIEQAVGTLQAQIPFCIQKSHLMRYDAFDNVGGQQSFSLVLLDSQHSGIVLSGVYNRMDMRVYAKYVERGQPTQPLSEEETQVVRECLSK